MGEPNWAKLLKFFYEKDDQSHKYGAIKESIFEGWQHPIMEETGLSREELYSGLVMLENRGLIDRGTWGLYHLTDKGFELAHDREMTKQQVINNDYIAVFTVVLGMTAFTELTNSLKILSINTKLFLVALIPITIISALILMLREHHSFAYRWKLNKVRLKIREFWSSRKSDNDYFRQKVEELSENEMTEQED